jgi:hypothetical protein
MSAPAQLRSRKWAAAAAQFLSAAAIAGVRVDRDSLPALGVRTQPQSPAHHATEDNR